MTRVEGHTQISVLGPVEVSAGGRPVPIGAGKPRALLALLALHEGSTVSTDRLVEGLWGEEPPATAVKMVQLGVSQLRRALATAGDGAEIVTRGRGYELRLGDGGLDARRFERLIADGRPREALALWRGAPLADVAGEPFAAAEIRRLEELYLVAVEQAIDRDLEAGRHREVLGELEALVAVEPLRERLQAQRMLALYRSGRQGEALEAYRAARRALVEAIGMEPGPELRRLQEAILRQDRSLEPPGAEVSGLPAELDAGIPLAGREAELDWLRERWRGAHAGAGRSVLIAGGRGIGKSRLAAELATEVHGDRAAVLYASGAGAPAAARTMLERAQAARRPTLLVLDDLDRAGDELRSALGDLVDALAALPVLVVATAEDPALASELGAAATLMLAPLDADGVAAVAQRYARGDAEPPLARLVEASGGVPQRIHRAAREWAHTEAGRRLDAAAVRAASERAGLRVAEDELAGSVVELQAVRERARPAEGDAAVVCPFKGLTWFDVEDAGFFFGRERLVAELVARLAGAPLMGIVGPSGSGKSSALRAGLLPALAAGVLPGSERWAVALLRPGEHPLRALEQATAEAAPDGRLVVAVDQFEETFTACREESERAAFVDALVGCVRDARRRGAVLVAVRADFYGRCAAYPELWRLLGANQVTVGSMRRDELRRAIELPAQRAGLRVEPELADALIADVEGEPGGLPLLSTSLLELWQHRDGRRLRLGVYEQAGGVKGAVARLAEGAYARLDMVQQRVARAILLRLAGEGEGDAAVRARVPLGEFAADARPVLAELTDSRLLTVSEGEVEVAHEALLREWPRLRGWLEEDAQGRRLHRHLRAAANEWQAGGRDPGELYRGARLASVLEWLPDHEPEVNATEHAFLADSRAASERAQRRLRMMLAGVAALLVLAIIAGVVALDQRGSAREQAVAAAAERLGAQALADNDLDRSLLLARQGVALDDSLQTRSNLLAALLKSPAAIGVLHGDGDGIVSIALSPDDRTLAMIDADGTLSLFDTRTRRLVAREAMHGFTLDTSGPDALRFSDDGTRLAVGGWDPTVLDTRTLTVVAHHDEGGGRVFYGVRFAPDGRTLLMSIAGGSGHAITVQHFAVANMQAIGLPRVITQRDVRVELMLTHDGRRVVTTLAGRTEIRDATTLRPLRRWPVGADVAALSPSDRTLLLGGNDGSVRFLDLGSGHVRTASGGHAGPVVRATFSPDGRTAVTAGADNRVIVWDVRRGAMTETLENHAGQTTSLAISRDGHTLYTGANDGKAVIWDLTGQHRINRPFRIGPARATSFADFPFISTALSNDGRILAAGHDDGTVSLIDVRTLRPISTFPAVPGGPVRGMGYIPHTGLLVVCGDDGFLGIFDPDTGRRVQRLQGDRPSQESPVAQLPPSFSADGRLMAVAEYTDNVLLWRLRGGRAIGTPRRYSPSTGPFDLSLSPNGRTMAVVAVGIDVVDVATLRRRASLPSNGTASVRPTVISESTVAQFTPDGSYVIEGGSTGWSRVWSTKTWRPVGRVLAGHTGQALAASVSPDGRTVATGSEDGTIRLYDLATQKPVGAPLPAVPNRPVVPLFTPDGDYLLAVTSTGQAYRWDVRPAAWEQRACAVAGRTLTRVEWSDALPGRTYAPACAN